MPPPTGLQPRLSTNPPALCVSGNIDPKEPPCRCSKIPDYPTRVALTVAEMGGNPVQTGAISLTARHASDRGVSGHIRLRPQRDAKPSRFASRSFGSMNLTSPKYMAVAGGSVDNGRQYRSIRLARLAELQVVSGGCRRRLRLHQEREQQQVHSSRAWFGRKWCIGRPIGLAATRTI